MSHISKAEAFYKPHRKHPELFQEHFLESWLHPDMLEIVQDFEKYYEKQWQKQQEDNGNMDEIDTTLSPMDDAKATQISSKLNLETSGVYSFECLSESFLEMINEELFHFYKVTAEHDIPVRRPNSMNNYGVILNEIGMRPMITALQQQYIWPIARVLFPTQGKVFHDHHSFIVRYQADEDLGLDMHTDDSDGEYSVERSFCMLSVLSIEDETLTKTFALSVFATHYVTKVTFNVCLGDKNFTGATLVFCGTFGQADHRQFQHTYHHKVGRAVMHLGDRRHGAEDIDEGTRMNWIVWNHNWEYRSSPQYKQRMTTLAYQAEHLPPSKVCLSYTHDRDYTHFHSELPKAAEDLHLHPWCPPPGKEYEGYGKVSLRHKLSRQTGNGETHPNEL